MVIIADKQHCGDHSFLRWHYIWFYFVISPQGLLPPSRTSLSCHTAHKLEVKYPFKAAKDINTALHYFRAAI